MIDRPEQIESLALRDGVSRFVSCLEWACCSPSIRHRGGQRRASTLLHVEHQTPFDRHTVDGADDGAVLNDSAALGVVFSGLVAR